MHIIMKEGHTIIELLLVISLIAVLAMFAIPSMQHLFLMNKMNTDVNQLVRLLNYARNLAIIETKPVIICPMDPVTGECGKNWEKGLNVYIKITSSQKVLMKSLTNFTGVELRWNRQSNQIIFAENGLLSSQNGSFIYQILHEPYNRQIILSNTGRVRISKIQQL